MEMTRAERRVTLETTRATNYETLAAEWEWFVPNGSSRPGASMTGPVTLNSGLILVSNPDASDPLHAPQAFHDMNTPEFRPIGSRVITRPGVTRTSVNANEDAISTGGSVNSMRIDGSIDS